MKLMRLTSGITVLTGMGGVVVLVTEQGSMESGLHSREAGNCRDRSARRGDEGPRPDRYLKNPLASPVMESPSRPIIIVPKIGLKAPRSCCLRWPVSLYNITVPPVKIITLIIIKARHPLMNL